MTDAREDVLKHVRRLEREEALEYVTHCIRCKISFPAVRKACTICGADLQPINKELEEDNDTGSRID